jgi:ATP-dependent Clp protease protease subunit
MTKIVNARTDEDDEDDFDMKIQKLLPYQTYEATRQQRIFTFYLSDSIGEPRLYTDMIHKIRVAQPQDIVYIHLNTPGGRLDTGMQLINAMKDSQARIVAVLDSKAYSLGTLIFLAADEFIVHDNCLFMMHNFSSAVFGKGNEQARELEATLVWFKKLAYKYYYPFLSKDEIEKMLNGQDIWMDSDEVKKRLNAMVKQQAIDAAPKPRRRRNDTVGSVDDGVLPEPTLVTVDPVITTTTTKTSKSSTKAAKGNKVTKEVPPLDGTR